jgi:TonB family protein
MRKWRGQRVWSGHLLREAQPSPWLIRHRLTTRMPTTPPQIDPELPRTETEGPQGGAPPNDEASPDAPVSVVPHDAQGKAVTAPMRIRTNRFGELEEHELVRLLDTIEDERARGRFRESIYISLFIWLAIAWVAFYGPKYLWHSPQLISPTEALQQQEMVRLNAPVLPHRASAPPPKIDRGTLDKLRTMEAKRTPAPVFPKEPAPPSATQPLPSNPAPELPKPAMPVPVTPRPAMPVPEAPAPQPATKPNFSTPGSASQEMQQAMEGSKNAVGDGGTGIRGGGNGRAPALGAGPEILSDTQGVNFQPYLGRIMRMIYEQWIPLIPEEARPPLSKQGTTLVRFTINPDGTIGMMHLDGSTHDDALNRAAWGSIPAVGKFPPLPKEFHGPNLELRIHFLVNQHTE